MKRFSTLLLVLTALLVWPLSGSAEEVLFDFENNNGNWPVGEGVNFADGNITAPLVMGDVTLTNVQGDATQPARIMRANDGVSALYVYKNGAIKLNAADGLALTKVEVTMKSGSFDLSASNGTIEADVWTGNATEVTFTSSATRMILKLQVVTDAKNDETLEPAVESYDVEAADIAAFKAAEDGQAVKLQLTDARINAFNDIFSYYYLEDASGALILKGISQQLKAGDVLNGYVIGTKSSSSLDWSGDYPDYVEYTLVAAAENFAVGEGLLTGTLVEVGAIANADNHGRLLTIENVTIQKEGRFYYAYSGEDKVQVKDELGVLPADYEWPTDAVDVTGVATFNGVRWQLAPVTADAITVHVSTYSHLVDFANNNYGMTYGENGENSEAGNLASLKIGFGTGSISFVNSPTMPTRYYSTNRGPHFQMIKGGQLCITANPGTAIVAVRSTPNKTTNPSTGATVTNVSWTVDKGEGALSSDQLEWTGNSTYVRFTATGATYLDAIEIVTADATDQTITPEEDVYTEVASLAEFNALPDGTLAKIALNNAVITATALGPSRWAMYVQDATAAAHMYCMPFDFEVGMSVTGDFYCVKSNQTAGPRIAMSAKTFDSMLYNLSVEEGQTVEPLTGTIAELSVTENLNRVVMLENVSFAGTKDTEATATDAEGTTITIVNTSTGMSPYVITNSFEGVSYASATITGILYGTAKGINLYPLSITENVIDGVSTVKADGNAAVVYNLQGQRQQQLRKGINIVGGRKLIVK